MEPRTSAPNLTRTVIALQLALGLAVLAATALLPGPGDAALVVPLRGGAAGTVALAAGQHTTVLARGPFAGSLVLRAPDSRFAFAAMASGAIALAVPSTACASRANPTNRT